MEDKKVVLSVQDLNVKFTLRGQILHAIRGISLDVYQGESLAIVGESGSGKSVFVKCAMGLLDANGYIDDVVLVCSDSKPTLKTTAFTPTVAEGETASAYVELDGQPAAKEVSANKNATVDEVATALKTSPPHRTPWPRSRSRRPSNRSRWPRSPPRPSTRSATRSPPMV